jgi:outer membrane protein assembly factor BamB
MTKTSNSSFAFLCGTLLIAFLTDAAVLDADESQLGFTNHRNNVSPPADVPRSWSSTKRLKWRQPLGSVTNGSPVVASGRVFIGTNNGAGYLRRFPSSVDLGVLLCFDVATGNLLWQYSCEKLPSGKIHDWPEMGICSTPLVEGNRLWLVSSRGEVVCLDVEGFHDAENDGATTDEANAHAREADIVWRLDMMRELGVQQHNMANCSVTSAGGILLVCTGNGIDRTHEKVTAPDAPSFLGIEKTTGRVVWTDNSPGENVLHGQWSSPAVTVVGGVTQAIFAGGDGWLYSFDPGGNGDGSAKMLWQFDCNPKVSQWDQTGRDERDNIIAIPVVHQQRVYVATGRSPDQGEGHGRLWCVDVANAAINCSDVSEELAVGAEQQILAHRRIQAVNRADGESVRANPNSSAVWCYTSQDWNQDGKLAHSGQMHRTMSSVVAEDALVIAVDLSGVVHCLDALNGTVHWTCDLLEEVWASPLIVGNRVIVVDTGGTISMFHLSADPQHAMQQLNDHWEPPIRWQLDGPIHSTPTVSAGVLYVATQHYLYALDLANPSD